MQFYKQTLELSGIVTASAFVLALIGYVVLTSEIMWVEYKRRTRGHKAV
jgi:hypothetical protein